MAGLVDAAVDATTKMFDEGAEQARVGLTDGEVAIEKNAGCLMSVFSVSLECAFCSVLMAPPTTRCLRLEMGTRTASLSCRE